MFYTPICMPLAKRVLAVSLGIAPTVLWAASGAVFADDNEQADAAFCRFTMDQALAQRDIFRTPSLVVGPVAPSTGTAPQMVIGITNSLADHRKAALTVTAAQKACALYKSTTAAQIHILYDLPAIEKAVFMNRLRLIESISDRLDGLISEQIKLVDSHNLTTSAMYVLRSAKIRLDAERMSTLTSLGSIHVPPQLNDTPLKTLIDEKMQNEDETQRAEYKLLKQGTWDLQMNVGFHQSLPIGPTEPRNGLGGAYAVFNVTYNFRRNSIGKHLEDAAVAHNEWKRTQFDDVAAQAVLLKRQIMDTIATQKAELKILREHDTGIANDLQSLNGIDTRNAIGFKNTLLTDQMMLRLDIEDTQFRVNALEQYLVTNFYPGHSMGAATAQNGAEMDRPAVAGGAGNGAAAAVEPGRIAQTTVTNPGGGSGKDTDSQ